MKSVATDESQLIHRARQGDSAAFGSLVLAYQDRLYTSMVHLLGCTAEAEDVVQDAFVQAYRKLESFEESSRFYTWLYRIAFNRAIAGRRRRRDEPRGEGEPSESAREYVDPGDSPGEMLLRAEQVEQVREAVGRLPDEFRAVMVLRELEGCDYESIASILNISTGTVRSRLHRARAQLRLILRSYEDSSR